MDKLISLVILIAIILAFISEILPIIAISAGIVIVGVISYKVSQFITTKRRYRQDSLHQMNLFLNALSSKTNLTYNIITDIESGKQYVEDVFNNFVNTSTIPPRITHLFKELCSLIDRGFAKNTFWICRNIPKSLYEISGSSLSRAEINITSEIPISSGLFNSLLYLVLHGESGNFILTPLFIIYISKDDVTFIEWANIETGESGDVRVKEDAFSTVRGAHSLYHRYLHERVNGGPDRRYNYNPSWSVNQYFFINLRINDKPSAKVLCTNGFGDIVSKLNQFKKSLTINAIHYEKNERTIADIVNQETIQDNCRVEDEYASLFKKIIDERGKDILKERLFLSLLADYKVFKEKRFLRPFLETMTEEGYWKDLTEGTPTVDTLNKIKKKFTTIHHYPEHEAAEAVSYLGYGLGITA